MDERVLPTITGANASVEGETPLRILVLGSLYAAAVFFAVAFSPAIGFVNLHASADMNKIASAEQAQMR